MSMMWPPQSVKMVSTPSFFRALATRWPPEMTLVSRLLRLSVSSAVVVLRVSGDLVAVSCIDASIPMTCDRSGRALATCAARPEPGCLRSPPDRRSRRVIPQERRLSLQRVARFGVAAIAPVRLVYALRIGFKIRTAASAATILRMAAVMNTGCQFTLAAMTLVRGISSDAVPFAVYLSQGLVVA